MFSRSFSSLHLRSGSFCSTCSSNGPGCGPKPKLEDARIISSSRAHGLEAYHLGCGFLLEDKVGMAVLGWGERFAHVLRASVPPSPLGSSGIITLARNSPQNPDVKELRY